MRIGIVSPFNPAAIIEFLNGNNVPSINNTATAVNTLVYELLKQGHTLKVFTFSSSVTEKAQFLYGKNVTVYLIPSGINPRFFGVRQFGLGQFYQPQRLAKAIQKEIKNIDVLHAHWTYEYAKAASMFSDKVPVFDTVRDWCPYQLSLMKGKKKIDWLLKEITFKQVMSDTRITFVANSSYTYNMITRTYAEKRVPIIPNPIDKRWILDNKKSNIKHNFISIAANLCDSRKNIVKLLEAFAEYRKLFCDASLHLIGSYDNDGDEYREWNKRDLLNNVCFYGPVSHDKLRSLLDEMSVLVHPSVEETFGNILLEAMSRCVPCIGGEKSGAVPDVLGHGEYGLLCNVNDSHSIMKAMVDMNDEGTRNRLILNATKMLKEKYASDMIAFKHIELYKSVIF